MAIQLTELKKYYQHLLVFFLNFILKLKYDEIEWIGS